MGMRELVALLSLSSWCLVMIVWLFFAVPWVCLQFVVVVFPDHTHLILLAVFLHYLSFIATKSINDLLSAHASVISSINLIILFLSAGFT